MNNLYQGMQTELSRFELYYTGGNNVSEGGSNSGQWTTLPEALIHELIGTAVERILYTTKVFKYVNNSLYN